MRGKSSRASVIRHVIANDLQQLQCLTKLVPQSTCALSNQTCLCTNADLNKELSVCVAASCTVKESLSTLSSDAHCTIAF